MRQSLQKRIILKEDTKIFTQDAKITEILNISFSNAIKHIKIPEFEEVTPFAIRVVNRYWNQLSNTVNIQASLLLIILPMGQRFSFDVLALMMHLTK